MNRSIVHKGHHRRAADMVTSNAEGSPTQEPARNETLGEHLIAQRQPLLRYLTKMLAPDLHLAEDIAQEALLRAFIYADRIEWRTRPILPWLLRIAHNLAVDSRRRDRAAPVGIAAEAFVTAPRVRDVADGVVDRHVLVDALRRISRPQQEVIAQLYLLGRGGDEAARHLGIPPGTVKSRTFTAVRCLRAQLDGGMAA